LAAWVWVGRGGLPPANHELAVEIAGIPEYVRGFDSVKDEQLAAAREKEANLLAEFRLRSPRPAGTTA
jgi:indolepyruvate ferredoxin oxidoreductase